MKLKIIKYRKIYYTISSLLILISLGAIIFFGINLGIEFVGGSVLEAEYLEDRPQVEDISEKLEEVGLRELNIQPLGEKGFLIRTDAADEKTRREIASVLEGAEVKQFESIGPAVGEELKNMSLIAILLASFLVILYIAMSFKESDGSISSVKYGVIATAVAFLHDVFIVLGIFAILGNFYGVQVTIPIAVALLTTLGYSINDTVVIFDRLRENIRKQKNRGDSLEEIVDSSLNQTIGRSVGTSVTTLLVLFALLFLGGATLYYFVLALILGVFLGTYSSIFLVGPLVLDWNNLTSKKK